MTRRIGAATKAAVDATGGSIATVHQLGTFGLTWATPIPLPEQTLVLGMGAAHRTPHWDVGAGKIRAPHGSQPYVELRHPARCGAAGRLLARRSRAAAIP